MSNEFEWAKVKISSNNLEHLFEDEIYTILDELYRDCKIMLRRIELYMSKFLKEELIPKDKLTVLDADIHSYWLKIDPMYQKLSSKLGTKEQSASIDDDEEQNGDTIDAE